MKYVMMFVLITVIAGGVYHEEVTEFATDIAEGSSGSGDVTLPVGAARRMGDSSSSLMDRMGGALGR